MDDSQNSVHDCVEIDGKDVWTDTVEMYLISLMIEEVKKGNKTTTTFSRKGWNTIREQLKAKFGKDYSYAQLKNKYNSLRTRQRNFKKLIKESGIGYNATTREVIASENIWDNLSKVTSYSIYLINVNYIYAKL